MDKTSRALRRYHRERLLARAYHIFITDQLNEHEHALWRARRMHSNMKACSCSMCCNQRSNPWLKNNEMLTMQERRAYDDYLCQLEEVEAWTRFS